MNLETCSNTELEHIFASLGAYTNHFSLAAEMVGQYEHSIYPLPTVLYRGHEILSIKDELHVDLWGIQSLLMRLWIRHITPEYLLLMDADLRAILHTAYRHLCTVYRGTNFTFLSHPMVENKRIVLARENRLSQGTMMFLYRKEMDV